MPYEQLADLVETHKETVVQGVAREAIARHLSNIELQTLVKILLPSIEMTIQYIRLSDITAYRENIRRITIDRLERGTSAESFYAMADVLTYVLKQLIERELPGPDHANERERYFRRCESMQALAQATIVATRTAFKSQKPTA